jgi:hypothetical protein
VKYTTIELDKRDDGDSVQAVLGEMTGAKSVSEEIIESSLANQLSKCLGASSICEGRLHWRRYRHQGPSRERQTASHAEVDFSLKAAFFF